MKRVRKSMFSLFRDTESLASTSPDSEIQQAKRMDLEERQVYRKSMLSRSIHQVLLSMGVDDSMFTLAIVPTDGRHHRFAVMIDAARSFLEVNATRTISFAEIEVLIRANIYNRFGILSVAMYWRVGDAEPKLESSADSPGASGLPGNLIAAVQDPQSDHIRTYSMQAPTIGLDSHRVQIDYDPTELDDGIMIGGTQYGRL